MTEKSAVTRSAITIGKFDGFHRGHQELLRTLCLMAQQEHLRKVVFKIDTRDCQILSGQEQIEVMNSYGIQDFIRQPFTKDFSSLSPERFIREILVDRFHAAEVVVGKDFRFGKDRRGDVDMLAEAGKEFDFHVSALDKVPDRENDCAVSSTEIRHCLTEGRVEEAEKLLNRPFGFKGVVRHGKKIGRTLGFPTINLVPEKEKLIPKNGVYASRTFLETDEGSFVPFSSITNIGTNPTVSVGQDISIETFLYDFHQDIYGAAIRIQLVHFLRGEKKFDSTEALAARIQKDIQESKKYL